MLSRIARRELLGASCNRLLDGALATVARLAHGPRERPEAREATRAEEKTDAECSLSGGAPVELAGPDDAGDALDCEIATQDGESDRQSLAHLQGLTIGGEEARGQQDSRSRDSTGPTG